MKTVCYKYLLAVSISCISLYSYGEAVQKVGQKSIVIQKEPILVASGIQTAIVFDSSQIEKFFNKYPLLNSGKSQVTDFYSKRNFAYAWYYKGVLIEQAGNLTNRVLNFKSDGLNKGCPYQGVLDSLINGVAPNANNNQPDTQIELMLTAQYFNFSKSAYGGVGVSSSRLSGWFLPRKQVAYGQYLDSLVKGTGKQAASKEPVYRQYELLRTSLKRYTKLQAADKWLPIIFNKKIMPGDTSVKISRVRARLYKLADFNGDTLSNAFDAGLQRAVKIFQDRHGLVVNGLLNKETLAELNISMAARIKQILVNMERSRWLPVNLNQDYIAINIPEFKMHVYHADSLLWSCGVVVGQAVHPTTVFYGEIENVVFSPYWNIPTGILRKEILPGMKRNANYLKDHNMEITGYKEGSPVIRQKPGPANSLGLIKFLFPNSYNIYLHDTPSKSLFGETSRAFSHGCIRVSEPDKLAEFLLKNDDAWTPYKIARAMHDGTERYVTLKDKVPVFIAYFTAFVDRDGHLNFRKDIYHLDERLASMIISAKAAE